MVDLVSPTAAQRRLAGRVALVTGANRNIGAAVAERLGLEGAFVAVNHRSPESAAAAREVVKTIRSAGGHAEAFLADVANETEVVEMVEAIEAVAGGPDLLVNNAAADVAFHGRWHQTSPERWNEVTRVNVTGAFLCARALYPFMRQARRGVIINMSSIRALTGLPGALHYTTSKAALLGFTRGLAREVGIDNIRVNAIIVGAIDTPNERVHGTREAIDAVVLAGQALKRRGLPTDVAALTAFLASEDANFITGQCILLDGGWAVP